MYVLMFKLYL